jgi:hydroxyacylglutathione hydrolase
LTGAAGGPLIVRAEQGDWLSNAYLVIDRDSARGVLVDSNGVTDPLVELADRDGIAIERILLTHHHYDHVVGVEDLAERYGVAVAAHPLCAEQVDAVSETIDDGDVMTVGAMRIEAMHTPGHCADHLALLLGERDCLTADLIFRGTVGGTAGPTATGLGDLRSSIMDRVMKLPPETRIHPGHRGPSTIAEEWESNPFVRLWRGLDQPGSERCEVGADEDSREAELLLWGPDYDGGNKALVRFSDDGVETIIGGSQVRRDRAT